MDKPTTPRYDKIDVELCRYLLDKVREAYPFIKAEPTVADFNAMKLLRVKDEREPSLIRAVIDWTVQDDFWSQNIRSIPTLRRQFDTLLIRIYRDKKRGGAARVVEI